jgi:outer membrane protein assembly factor BamE (lipoprotein component of BamABCDE complex)
MFKPHVTGLVSLAASLLPGCDAIYLDEFKPGVSTAAQIRERMGPPSAEHPGRDGGFVWEYNRQPQGVHTHMLSFGADRILRSVEQVLSDAHFARLQPGMDRDEVRRLLGSPGRIETFPRKREEVWDWRIEGPPPHEEWHFHAHFGSETGLLITTSKMATLAGG